MWKTDIPGEKQEIIAEIQCATKAIKCMFADLSAGLEFFTLNNDCLFD